MRRHLFAAALMFGAPLGASAGAFMDAEWASGMCEAWNGSTELTEGLGGDWSANNAGRGYKVIRLYRTDCGEDTAVQLTISDQEGKAVCTYGGAPSDEEMNYEVDYLMHATDEDWACMGKGSWGCGAMGAMMTGKLQFQGPKMEAMGVMGPFNEFLQLTDEVPGDMDACPE